MKPTKTIFFKLFLVISLFYFNKNYSQNFDWAKSMGGASTDNGRSVAVDASGNVYSIGTYQGTVDFDPGPGVYNLTSAGSLDVYISKLDASGNFVWAKSIGGTSVEYGVSIAVDGSGNVYTTGYYFGTVDFDPNAGVYNLTAASYDVFISKLDASGNFIWANSVGGTSSDNSYGLTLDASGNVYVVGNYLTTADFDPSASVYNLTASGSYDIFVLKLDASGNFIWAKSMGGTSAEYCTSVTVDGSGNVYTTGYYFGTVDFDPGTGVYNITTTGSYDIYISKLDALGNFVWAKSIGGTGLDYGNAITKDASGNIYLTGYYQATADFDPGVGTYNLTPIGSNDVFILKLDASGNFTWAKSIGGIGTDAGNSINVDALGNVYTMGNFSNTVDFDPGAGITYLTSNGGLDVFILKLDNLGNYKYAGVFGGTSSENGYSSTIDAVGNHYTTGAYMLTADLNPGTGVYNLNSAGISDAFVLKLNPQCTLTATASSSVTCSGSPVTLSASGVNTYTWMPGNIVNSSVTVSPTTTTIYTVTGTDLLGCVTSNTINALVNPKPTITVSSSTTTICAGSSATLTASGIISYTWNSGATTSTIAVTPSITTTYTISGTDALGCSNTQTYSLMVNPKPILTTVFSPTAICPGGTATLSASGATSYTWNPGALIGPTVTVTRTVSTSYVLTGKDAFGCTNTKTTVLTVKAKPTITFAASTPTAICDGATAILTPTGAVTYTWSSGATTTTIAVTPTTTTNYTVTGTGTTGCINTKTMSLLVNANPVVSTFATPGTICSGATSTLVALGANSYTWSPGSTVGALITVNPTTSTIYTVTGKNGVGCTNATTVSLTVNPLPTISVNSGAICYGQSFTMIPSGAVTYTYSSGSNIVNPSVNTTYTVTGTDANGCVNNIGTVSSVTVNSLPSVSVSASSSTICSGSSSILTASGATSYTWNTGSTTSFINVSPTSSASYTTTGTNAAGCTNTATVYITVNSNPILTSLASPTSICPGASSTLSSTGALTFTWNPGSLVGSPVTVTPTTTTTYTVTGTNAAGCTNTKTVTVTVKTLPTITIASSPTAICIGSTSTLTPTGAVTYTWSTGATTRTISVSPITTTDYTVTGTGATGCTNTKTISVIVHSNPSITASASSNSFCIGGNTTLTANGGVSYVWNPGTSVGSSISVSPTSSTIYTATGTDVNGCSSSNTVALTVNSLPAISVNSGAICIGESFTITPTGALSYTYSGGSNIVTPTSTSNYTVTGTDGNGCINSSGAISSVVVNSLPNILVNNGGICPGQSYTITPTGAISYTYSSGSNIVSPSSTTTYTVDGTSAQGCLSSTIVTVTVGGNLIFNTNSGTICLGDSYTITPTGAVSYTYSSGSPIVSPTTNTSYTVTGEDATGCTGTAISSVTVNTLPIINVNNGAICPSESFTIIPTGALSYTYSGGSDIVSPTATTDYTVTGTDANGCVSLGAISSVTVNSLPIINLNTGGICVGGTFTIIPNGALSYTYSSGTDIVSPTVTTDYTVTGTDANGCIGSAVVTVTVGNNLIFNTNSGSICLGDSYTITPTGAVSYTYSSGSPVVSPTTNTTYTVIGEDATGCSGIAISSVTVNTLPIISVNSGSICSGLSFTMVPTGALTYTYSGGSDVVSPITTTDYTVTGTDANGCSDLIGAVSSVTVISSPIVSATASQTLLCDDGMLASVLTASTTATTYLWSDGATTMSTSVSPTLTTTYTVTVTESGCSSDALVTITVMNCNGIEEIENNTISIYPNPTNGLLNVSIINKTSDMNLIEIYDSMGKLVVKENLVNDLSSINVNHLSNGIYFIKIKTDKEFITKRIIKQ